MNKKTVRNLLVCFGVTLVVVWSLLFLALKRAWIEFSPHDAVAGPVVLVVASLVGLAMIFLIIGIGLYVNRDSRLRGMEPVPWTLAAVLLPYFLGLILYLIVRRPVRTRCTACGASAPDRASFCPACGRSLILLCRKCQAPVLNGARFCHGCGTERAAV